MALLPIHRIAPFLLTVAVALLSTITCTPLLRIQIPICGRVIDVHAKTGIQGAIVRLDRDAHCLPFPDTHYYLDPLETKTNAEGQFTISNLSTKAPCLFPEWSDHLTILAPGYFPRRAFDTEAYTTTQQSVRSGTFELTPIKYQIERDSYGHLKTFVNSLEKNLSEGRQESGLTKAISAARTLPVKSLTGPGIFTIHSGAEFNLVSVVVNAVSSSRQETIILAQDRGSKFLHGWTPRGENVTLPSSTNMGLTLVGGNHKTLLFPLLTKNDRIYFPADRTASLANIGSEHWFSIPTQFGEVQAETHLGTYLLTLEANGNELAIYDLDRWYDYFEPKRQPGELREVLYGPRIALKDALPGAEPPIECMATVKGPPNYTVFITQAAGERAVFIAFPGNIKNSGMKAERVASLPTALSGRVTACAGGKDAFYIALKDRGISRVQVQSKSNLGLEMKMTEPTNLSGPSGPLTFLSLAVGDIAPDLDYLPFWEAVYAVAGDDKLYRFSTDLRPDQRIEFTP